MKIEKLRFILENTDVIEVDGKYIGEINISDIRTSISRVACNAVMKMDVCHNFFVELHRDADKVRFQFGHTIDSYKQTVFDRLQGRDITSIELTLVAPYPKDEADPYRETYRYYLHWAGDRDYVNEAEQVYISKSRHMYILVNENTKIEDMVDMLNADDEEYTKHRMEMYEFSYDW